MKGEILTFLQKKRAGLERRRGIVLAAILGTGAMAGLMTLDADSLRDHIQYASADGLFDEMQGGMNANQQQPAANYQYYPQNAGFYQTANGMPVAGGSDPSSNPYSAFNRPPSGAPYYVSGAGGQSIFGNPSSDGQGIIPNVGVPLATYNPTGSGIFGGGGFVTGGSPSNGNVPVAGGQGGIIFGGSGSVPAGGSVNGGGSIFGGSFQNGNYTGSSYFGNGPLPNGGALPNNTAGNYSGGSFFSGPTNPAPTGNLNFPPGWGSYNGGSYFGTPTPGGSMPTGGNTGNPNQQPTGTWCNTNDTGSLFYGCSPTYANPSSSFFPNPGTSGSLYYNNPAYNTGNPSGLPNNNQSYTGGTGSWSIFARPVSGGGSVPTGGAGTWCNTDNPNSLFYSCAPAPQQTSSNGNPYSAFGGGMTGNNGANAPLPSSAFNPGTNPGNSSFFNGFYDPVNGNSLYTNNAFVNFLPPYTLNPNPNATTSNLTIVAYGDSVVSGRGTTQGNDFVSVLERNLGTDIVNAGESGRTTAEALQDLDSEVLERDPDVVILFIGGNDILQNVPRQTMFQNVSELVRRIRESGATVVLLGIHGPLYRIDYESEYRNIASANGVIYVPSVLQGIIGNPYLLDDVVHPNDQGHLVIANRVRPALTAAVQYELYGPGAQQQ